MLSDQDSRALGRLLEQTSKLVLSFGRCVGSLCSPAVLVTRDITLLLRRKYLLGCVMILHDGILAIRPKWSTGLVFGFEQPNHNLYPIRTSHLIFRH